MKLVGSQYMVQTEVSSMHIIEEWFGKYGLLARFYTCSGKYFIDYNKCMETSEVSYNKVTKSIVVVNPDVPQKYVRAAESWFRKNIK